MKDYWNYTAILNAFKSTGYGAVEIIDGRCWRRRGRDLVLLDPPETVPRIPVGANTKRIRSLSWCDSIGADVPVKKSGGPCYFVERGWDGGKQGKRAVNKSLREGVRMDNVDQPAELLELLDLWIDDKTKARPNDMVVKGHYRAMVELQQMNFVGFYLQDQLVGGIGYAVEGREAVIGYAKHRYGAWWLSKAMWTSVLGMLLGTLNLDLVNCGDTANGLKQSLNMNSVPQFKVDFKQILAMEGE